MKKESEQQQNRYLKRIHQVQNYIEENLDKPFSLEELAEVSHFSPFHFHRLFKTWVGESVASYIRRLKLERAAQRLLLVRDNITTIALESGFETPSSFSKAFKALFSLSPSEFIESQTELKKQRFEPILESEITMIKHTLKEVAPFRVNFVRKVGDYFKTAPLAWNAIRQVVIDKDVDPSECQFYGLTHDNPDITSVEKCRFDACMKPKTLLPHEGELLEQGMGGGLYAIFTHTGPYDTLGDTYREIFGVWLSQQNDVELRDAPCFCHYVDRDVIDYPKLTAKERAELKTDIYIPIQTRK